MSTQRPSADTYYTPENQPTTQTETGGAQMMFAPDNEVPIQGLFTAESDN